MGTGRQWYGLSGRDGQREPEHADIGAVRLWARRRRDGRVLGGGYRQDRTTEKSARLIVTVKLFIFWQVCARGSSANAQPCGKGAVCAEPRDRGGAS